MSDLGGAILLSQQLEAYRWEDQARRARESNALSANNAAWRNHYNNLVDRYNRLAHDAKRLANVQEQALDRQAGHIAELTGDIAELKATNAALAGEVQKLRLEVLSVRDLLDLQRMLEEEKALRAQPKVV